MLIAACAFGMILPLTAFSELSNDSLLGPGMRSRPAYDGASSQHLQFVPVIRYFGQPWFVRSTQGVLEGGARMELLPRLHGGVQLAYEPGRVAAESEFLKRHNFSDINHGASLGLQLEWDHDFGPMPISLLMRTRQHTNSDHGSNADLRLSAGVYRNGRFGAGIFTQATWANAKAADTFYGITPQQSVITGLPAYAPGSGWIFGSAGVLWSLDVNRDWVIVGSLEARHQHGEAARSPLVERVSNHYVSAGVAYHF
jgi:outer membrane scaffolding protein for murein synthesis (MipA/OmpV family)